MSSERMTEKMDALDGAEGERLGAAREEEAQSPAPNTCETDRRLNGESEEIDRQIEALMLVEPSEEGTGRKKKKKRKKSPAGEKEKPAGKKPLFIQRVRGWSRKRKILTAVCLLAVMAFLGLKASGGNKDMGIPVTVIPLSKQSIQEKLSLNGPVTGTDSVDVVSNIHAEIKEMHVKEGDQVEKGQILAVLDRTDLEREVQIAQNAYDLAVNNKKEKDKEAALGYEKAVQDFQKASMDHNRNSLLFANGDISQMDLEASANALNDAKRQMEGYTVVNGRGVADKSYELQIQNAAFELEKKKEELENTQIKSSIDGTVVRVNSKVGQFADKVEDDKPMFSIENLEELELEIKVSEFSIGKVKVGQTAVISADILDGETVNGEVVKISPTGEEKGGGSTERVIPITIRVQGGNTKLIAGITAKAELLIREAEDTFVVPSSALFDEGDATYIAIVQDMRVKRIPVKLGVESDINAEVIPADDTVLEEGMQLITNAGPQLTDGAAVMVTPK